MTKGTLRVDDAELEYVRQGQGKPILSIGSATYYPKAYSDRLYEQFDFLFVDSRHFVPSYSPSAEQLADLTLETFASDALAIIDHLGLTKTAVIGHSAHAQIAISYARKYPERVTHLVLVCGVPYNFADFQDDSRELWEKQASEERKRILESRVAGLEERLATVPDSRKWVESYLANAPLYWANPEYDATWVFEDLHAGPALNRLLEIIPPRDKVRRALEVIDVPILVILGKRDYAIPYTAWMPLIDGLTNVTCEILPDDSHNPQVESPDRFDEALTEWFDKN